MVMMYMKELGRVWIFDEEVSVLVGCEMHREEEEVGIFKIKIHISVESQTIQNRIQLNSKTFVKNSSALTSQDGRL